MLTYTFKRLAALVPVLAVVSVVIFAIIHLTPGNPARAILGPEASAADVNALSERLGLNRPVTVQYFEWLGNAVTGNLGESLFLRKTVSQAIIDNAVPTVQLAVVALVVAVMIAVPLGTLAARYRGSALDAAAMAVSLVGMAVPSFVLGLVLILVFAVGLRVLPVAGYTDIFDDPVAGFRYLILPAVSLGGVLAAFLLRTTRASVLDVLSSEYIEAARSRGVLSLIHI